MLAACTSPGRPPAAKPTSSPAPAPCHTDVLAGWRTQGLAVLWMGRPGYRVDDEVSVPSAVAAIDVHNGQVRSYCPLPAPGNGPVVQQDYFLAMQQGGHDYKPRPTNVDLMLRTQWFSPDFRWFAAPGLPLIDVSAGRVVSLDWGGTLVGVGRDPNGDRSAVLIRTQAGSATFWCTRTLPKKESEGFGSCDSLNPPGGPGDFVIGTAGTPVWVPATAQPFAFGPVTGYATTDGARLYRADTASASDRATLYNDEGPSVQLDPGGLGGFIRGGPAQPVALLYAPPGWFTVESIASGELRTRYHHTTAQPHDVVRMWRDDASRAVVDGGSVAITALPDVPGNETITWFGALVDGTDTVIDLTKERGLRCPIPNTACRIIAWPDGSLGATPAPTSSPLT
jgi:hypothetical protein